MKKHFWKFNPRVMKQRQSQKEEGIYIKRGGSVPDNVLNRADNNKIDMPTKGEGTQMY